MVDYIGVSENLVQYINSFKVGELNEHSDHKPCFCTLDLNYELSSSDEILDNLEDAPVKLKWNNDDSKSNQLFSEAQNCPDFIQSMSELQHVRCSTAGNVLKLNKQVADSLINIVDRVIPKKNSPAPKTTAAKRTKKKGTRMKPKTPWFDSNCINAKRELNSIAKKYGKEAANSHLKDQYYSKRRSYRKLIKSKKNAFITQLSKDIESGNNINWNRFKKLKFMQEKRNQLNTLDMQNFCIFFKNLYGKSTLPSARLSELAIKSVVSERNHLQLSIDKEITIEELDAAILNLKRGKAVAEDLVANEFLKASGQAMHETLCHLGNESLRVGDYPWNTSLVTSLYKKGNLYDPDNYRAIAVASNLGKLFSSILLQRLIQYRESKQPDSPNQLGFRKNAQTSDHLLTLSTCISKYAEHVSNGRLYSCFVDFAKAFDTVCREALLYKLWNMGIRGRFFYCLQHMYSNSSAKVKLLNKLSDKIDVLCGTEQGHPMSPELFKCYINDFSEQLNSIEDVEVPILNNTKITHLLWADDLVLLGLNPESLQKLLDALLKYSLEWGLCLNIKKQLS